MSGLKEYKRKRNFTRTPEPSGEPHQGAPDDGEGGRFVIHKHAARNLHYDLRLEQDGVYKSWAVPKGPSLEPGEKRLAVKVEDHPLDYGEFEGVIPKGQYGSGTVMIWDRGRWASAPRSGKRKSNEDRLDFVLAGEKLRGAWTLARTAGRGGKSQDNWLLIKRHDKPPMPLHITDRSVASGRSMEQITADRDRRWTEHGKSETQVRVPIDMADLAGVRKTSLPESPLPALATQTSVAPAGDNWLHEIKFDGYRILTVFNHGEVTLLSRNGKDWTRRFPEIAAVLKSLAGETLVMDGEITALGADGIANFSSLQAALSTGGTEDLVYQAFDLIYLNTYDLATLSLVDRKGLLKTLLDASGYTHLSRIRYSDHVLGQGPEFFNEACKLGLEGIISKRADSAYRTGRSRSWLKVKCTNQEEFVIGGFTDPAGERYGFGALLLGAWDNGKLIYVGRVGTGFSRQVLDSLYAQLRELEIKHGPFFENPRAKEIHWVKPELVAQVEFSQWTADGLLRHSSFLGLREDKDVKEVMLPQRCSLPRKPTVSPSIDFPSKGMQDSTMAATNSKQIPDEKNRVRLQGVALSNPDRVLYPEDGITKLAIADFYLSIEEWLLPHLAMRPLSLLRCPSGYHEDCFFQKHPHQTVSKSVPRIAIPEKNKSANYLYVKNIADVIALVQIGALELHVWGSRVDDLEHPDLMVFDLDPGPDLPYAELLRVTRELRERLTQLGLHSFLRVTGGKGLHLVVPITPERDWDEVKLFCQAVARQHAQDDRQRVTANMAKKHRQGRVFVDYLRNGRSATAIASYSTRARLGAPVAVPIGWDELNPALRPDRYTVNNLRRRLGALQADPWADWDSARVPLSAAMFKAVGL